MTLSELLLHSKTGSEFLRRAEAHLKETEPDFSYAEFARKAGFSARSYVREIFQGRKALTLKALPQFSRALGLQREEREILRCLLTIEHSGFDPSLTKEAAEHSLNVRAKVVRRRSARTRMASPVQGKKIENWPRIYAAIGKDGTVPTLAKVTKLSPLAVTRALRGMMEAGLLVEEGDTYRPANQHVVLDPSLHQEMIHRHFSATVTGAVTRAKENFSDPERLYFVSSFGVSKNRLPELKKRLTEALLRFIDEASEDESEEVVSVAATLI